MTWLVLVIISAISSSVSRVLQKVLLKEKDSEPFAFAFVFQLLLALIFFLYTFFTKTLIIPNLSGLFFNLALMAIFYSLGNIFISNAFKLAEASEASIIFASSTLWTVVSAVIFLGDKLSIKNIVGIILVIMSIVIVNYSKSKWKINKGHLYAFLAALMFGIAFTNDAFIINRFTSVSSYMLLCFVLSSIAILLFRPKLIYGTPHFIKKNIVGKLLICGFFYSAMLLTIFEAYKRGGQVSIISPIQQSALILTVISSYFLLKEKDRLANKIIGTILTFMGVLLLV
jgi:bacterial/archaeal transporter family protein